MMAGFDNDVMWANNVDFRGVEPIEGQITTDGQLLIGSTASPNIRVGTMTAIGANVIGGAGSLRYDAYNFDIGVSNLGITYNAGTGLFSVTSASGAALSSSNPGYVTLPSKSAPGTKVTVQVTADQTFTDDSGSSTIIGNLFGLTTGIAHADPIPFFIYAVLNDAENAISFMVSRYPNTSTSPVAAKIGKTGSAIADTQGSFFALDDPTVADYEQNPCICIGSFLMTMSASDDWTVQTLSNSDGIGKFQDGISFKVSKGQFGAASGKWFLNNGGTAPDQTTGNFFYRYTVDQRNCTITLQIALENVNVVGLGSVPCNLVLPYQCDSTLLSIGGSGIFIIPSSAVFSLNANSVGGNVLSYLAVGPSTSAQLQNASFTDGTSFYFGDYIYVPVFL